MPRRFLKFIILVLPVMLSLLWASSALAIGIGVTPGKMHFDVHSGSSEIQILHVINQSEEESSFQIYIEDEQVDWIEITPESFVTDAHGTESVEITVEPPLTGVPKDYELSICVVSIAPNSELKIGAGVKVPVEIEVSEKPAEAEQLPAGQIAESPDDMGSSNGSLPIIVLIVTAVTVAALVIAITLIWKKARHD